MDIRSAASELERTVRAYLATDEAGFPLVPRAMQRPLLLIGPPGIGKTAIARQVAGRLNINFVSYSMTHHTRQSALGLPYIEEVTIDGRPCKVSRYTMSEIIAAAHDARAASGIDEGILFLDEVNCVSETLAPAMLQFLQFKTFGQHELPAGWVVVCAANPAEYNRAAREFDPATLDRLRRIDVEANLAAWMAYAAETGVHPAIVSYLEAEPDHFYRVHSDIDGTRLVTGRGWDDLSHMLYAYRAVGEEPDQGLVASYLTDEEVALSFCRHLELFSRHEDDYHVADILAGRAASELVRRAAGAPFDERMTLVELLAQSLAREAENARALEDDARRAGIHLLSQRTVTDVERARQEARVGSAEGAAHSLIDHIDAAFAFVEGAWGSADEVMVLTSRLAHDTATMHLASTYGCASLASHAASLSFTAATGELIRALHAGR